MAEDERRRGLGLGVSLCFHFFHLGRVVSLSDFFFASTFLCLSLFFFPRLLPSVLPPDAFLPPF